jgi:hypothetical protein
MIPMRLRILLFLLLDTCYLLPAFAQQQHRPVFWLGPANDVQVHGINIAPIINKMPQNSTVNGINIEGFGIPFLLFQLPQNPTQGLNPDNIRIRDNFVVNGIAISVAGRLHEGLMNGLSFAPLFSFIDQVNGLGIATLFNLSYRTNGVSISAYNATGELNGVQLGLHNKANRLRGLQLGLINKCGYIEGCQIGLWNVNEKRRMPLVNW